MSAIEGKEDLLVVYEGRLGLEFVEVNEVIVDIRELEGDLLHSRVALKDSRADVVDGGLHGCRVHALLRIPCEELNRCLLNVGVDGVEVSLLKVKAVDEGLRTGLG